MLDGKRLDSTVGTVEIYRDVEIDPYECVVFFDSCCTECGWKGKRRDNEGYTSSEARAAMKAEAEGHMCTAHPSARRNLANA